MTRWVRWGRLVGMIVLTVGLYFILPVDTAPSGEVALRAVGGMVVLGLLAYGMVRQIRMHVDNSSLRLDGLILGIVLVVVVFAYSFYSLEMRQPGEVAGLQTRVDALYFSLTTMTTVGTGDVHAAGQVARVLVIVQMVFNVLFVATAATVLTTRLRDIATNRSRLRQSSGSDER